MSTVTEQAGLREENRTLHGVIELVSEVASAGDADDIRLIVARGTRRLPEASGDTELAAAIAQIAAVAIERAELIEGLTTANTVKDLFAALAAGATSFAVAKAAELRCDLTAPYVMVCAEPAAAVELASVEWREAAAVLGRGLAALQPRAAVEAGPGPVRAALPLAVGTPERVEEILRECHELGAQARAAIGISQLRASGAEATRAYREALDAATIGRALLHDGGAIAYSQLGAYRYLVHVAADAAPRDRMREAVDVLIAYDKRRRSSLLDTLERYLAERRSVIESARALCIHPNTLRQRLARIEELTGVELDHDDLLSLELAIKLARLHGRVVSGLVAAAISR
jgi:purine catabolism regulator